MKGAIGLADARLWLADESCPAGLPIQDNRRDLVVAWQTAESTIAGTCSRR